MPSAEKVQEIEERKLRRMGFDSEGNPLEDNDHGNPINDPDDAEPDEIQTDEPPAPSNDPDDPPSDPSNEPADPDAEEVEALKRKLRVLEGRLTPAQRDAEDFRKLWRQSQLESQQREEAKDKEIQALRKQLEERESKIELSDILTEEEIEEINPQVLNAFVKLADSVAKRRMPKIDAKAEARAVLQERDAQKVKDHRRKVLSDPQKGLHKLSEYLDDSEFLEWTRKEDNDIEAVTNSLRLAQSTEEVDRYAKILSKRLAQYVDHKKESRKKPGADKPKAEPKPASKPSLRREPERPDEKEVKAKLKEAKALSRSRNPADRKKAAAILNEIE